MKHHLTMTCGVLVLAFCGPAIADPFRSIDGSGNNTLNPLWGQADTTLARISPADYPGDGSGDTTISSPQRPNPRIISNALFAQTASVPSARGLTSGVWQWGQFLDHDIDLTGADTGEASVIMSPGDPYGVTMIPFTRSNFESVGGVRQQVNSITSYIDASNVYGSDLDRANALREGIGGRMRTGASDLLPTDDMSGLGDLENANEGFTGTLFVAGDVRANEQVGLAAMHTLFVREHNRIADALAALPHYDPVDDDELIYLKARRIVGAEMQAITYNEFLPTLLGDFAPAAADYAYDPNVDASIASEFSTAMFRLGHSMLNSDLLLASEQGAVVGELALRDAFFRPDLLQNNPELVDKVLMGLSIQTAQEIDTLVVDDVRNFLFAPSGGVGLDLPALNIERGRDHGLPDYNTLRTAYDALSPLDLSPLAAWDDMDADPAVRQVLEELYGTIDNVDAWVGALAETHVEGASVGPLILAALVDQFTRLRDGDAYFYMGDTALWSDEVRSIVDFDDLRMMDIIAWNTEMDQPPMDFFLGMPAGIPEPTSLSLAVIVCAGLIWRLRR